MNCSCKKQVKVRRSNTRSNPRKCKCGASHYFCNQSLEFKSVAAPPKPVLATPPNRTPGQTVAEQIAAFTQYLYSYVYNSNDWMVVP